MVYIPFMEIWRACSFDERYKISNFGNIKRVISNGQERILKPSILNKGRSHEYKYIQVSKEGKRKNHLIHRLVAIAFIENDNPDYNIVDHIDRNTYNNNVDNLRWCNQKINMNNTKTNRTDILETDVKKRKLILSRECEKNRKAAKKYYCELCNIPCVSPSNLRLHDNSHRHYLRTQCKEEIGDLYNEENYQIWRKNRYDKQKIRNYIV